jgi:hypothetical protein
MYVPMYLHRNAVTYVFEAQFAFLVFDLSEIFVILLFYLASTYTMIDFHSNITFVTKSLLF